MERWFDAFLNRLGDGEWAADVALPLLVALLGVAVAVVLVRMQISADRRTRQADRRIEQLRPLTAELTQLVERLEAAPSDSAESNAFWAASFWPDEGKAKVAITNALPYLTPNARQSLTRISAAISLAWRSIAAVEVEADLGHRGAATRQSISPLVSGLREAIGQLERWDGTKNMPDLAPTRSVSVQASPESWAREFRQIVGRLR